MSRSEGCAVGTVSHAGGHADCSLALHMSGE